MPHAGIPLSGSVTERRCLASAQVRDKETMIRFVVGPDRTLVADIDGKLPGRGLWLSASRDMIQTACAKKLFAKAARQAVVVPQGLEARVEELLVRRCAAILGMARRAGDLVVGFEKVRAQVAAGKAGVLLAARDGAADGRRKIKAIAPHIPVLDLLSGAELGAAVGRPNTVHMAIAPGRLAERVMGEHARLSGFRQAENEMSADKGRNAALAITDKIMMNARGTDEEVEVQ